MKLIASELPESAKSRIMAATDAVLPIVLPSGWQVVERFHNGGRFESSLGLRLIFEVEANDNGGGPLATIGAPLALSIELWLHVSVSRRDRVPSYDDLKEVKNCFIGKSRKAIQVFPSESEHFNFHPYCLHLYSPLDRDPLPDFRTADGKL